MPTPSGNMPFTVTVRNDETGDVLHATPLDSVSPMVAVWLAESIPLADWSAGPAPAEIFTLQVFDHGVEVDSTWSSLELAQLAAVTITTETEDGANYGLSPTADAVVASVAWTHEEPSPSWRSTSPEDVGFVITRTTLNQPHQF